MSSDPHATQSTTEKVKNAARERADQAMNSEAVQEAKKGLEDLKKQASGQAREHVEAVKERLHGHAEERRSRLAENLKGVASGLDAAASEIRDKPETTQWQADGIARLSSVAKDAAAYLDGRDSKELLADAAEYARAHPVATIGAAVLLGVVGSRLLKASQERGHGASTGGSTGSGSPSGRTAGGVNPSVAPAASPSGDAEGLDPVAAHGTMTPAAPGPSTPAAVPPPPSRSFETSAPPPTEPRA